MTILHGRFLAITCACIATTVTGLILTPDLRLYAQIQAVNSQVRPTEGQPVSPIYEGWYEAPGGATYASFGYFNPNTEQIVDVPIGPHNQVEPGQADQGQPTRFAPGRAHGVFAVAVPKGQSKTEVTWTLTVNGKTMRIPANLNPLYLITPLREAGGQYPGNRPPVLKFDPSGTSIQGLAGSLSTRSTTLSKPLTLDVFVTDDGLPGPDRRRDTRPELSVTWSQYRGSGTVTFSHRTSQVGEGKATTTATFTTPGDYMLRVLVADGSGFSGQCCWTNGYVKVTVDRGSEHR